MKARTRPMPKSYIIEIPNKDKSDSESSEEESLLCEECSNPTIKQRRFCEECLKEMRLNAKRAKTCQ